MGNYDRDYMREAPGASGDPPATGMLVARVAIVVFSAFLIFAGFRAPLPLYAKLPLLVGIGFLVRILLGIPGKFEGERHLRMGIEAEGEHDYPRAVYHYEEAADRLRGDPHVMVRLLSAYHASNRVNRAKDLIATLDGKVFPGPVLEELEHLIAKYRSVSFARSGSGSRMDLGNN